MIPYILSCGSYARIPKNNHYGCGKHDINVIGRATLCPKYCCMTILQAKANFLKKKIAIQLHLKSLP